MSEIHPSLLTRKIIHIDMDAFFAAIEVRDQPELRGKPVVVGGPPSSRSVVSTANYEARKFGIHSAMPCSQAARLCPHAIFVPPRFDAYQAASRQIRDIFHEYTDLVEPLSLDEAYLDVTSNPQEMYATAIAKKIKCKVHEKTSLTCSAGVASNKLIAKIASDMNKPNGLTVVIPEKARNFMSNLPVRKLFGIGPVTEKRLTSENINRCSDVWKFSPQELEEKLGNLGAWLWEASQGIDHRSVNPTYIRKSLGREETYQTDLLDVDEIRAHLNELANSVAKDLCKREFKGRTIVLKVKYSDFILITRSLSIAEPTNDSILIAETVKSLLQKTEAGKKRIRLLGVSVSNLGENTHTEQQNELALF